VNARGDNWLTLYAMEIFGGLIEWHHLFWIKHLIIYFRFYCLRLLLLIDAFTIPKIELTHVSDPILSITFQAD
jgi:hypothetical protein